MRPYAPPGRIRLLVAPDVLATPWRGVDRTNDAMEGMGGGSERRVWAEPNAVEGRQQGGDIAAAPPWQGESEGLCRGRGRAVSE